MPTYCIPTPQQVTRAIRRYAHAVEAKSFDGTIPWNSEEARAAHQCIDEELDRAVRNLRSLIITTSVKRKDT